MSENQRQNFRLEYPPSERPDLIIAGTSHKVVDISEKGIKFQLDKAFVPVANLQITGQVRFKDGKVCSVTGSILRIEPNLGTAVLTLVAGIPLAKMMEEQRLLLQKYKK